MEWHQLGVINIFALPLIELAVEKLRSAKELLKEIIVVDVLINALLVVTGHVHEWNHTRKNLICNVKHSYYKRFFYQLHKSIQKQ